MLHNDEPGDLLSARSIVRIVTTYVAAFCWTYGLNWYRQESNLCLSVSMYGF